jgi:lipoprotein-anchoring transpeptidase ErfK/SrfK
VSVRPRLTLTATGLVYKGARVTFRVQAGPPHPGVAVTLQTRRAGAWVDLSTVTLDAESRARIALRAERSGRFAYRVRMAADAEHVAGASSAQHVLVRPPNPYHVPLRLARIVVVDLSQYRLYFFSHGREVRSFPCVLGRPSLPTPQGHFRIYAKGMNPGGPYGARIMSYHPPCAIHGTNEPGLLKRFPRNFSHGCTRLLNADAIWLYSHCPMGTRVWNVP